MTGHPRLFCRKGTYYHRAAIPVDIKETYPKSEETFSLRTKDYREALKRVRVAAANVDRLFEEHRHKQSSPAADVLTAEQLKRIQDVYYAHLLEEDEEIRLDGFLDDADHGSLQFAPTFDEYGELLEDALDYNKGQLARGRSDVFLHGEAEEVLTWDSVNLKLASGSPSWRLVERELLKATVRAYRDNQRRNEGEVVETPLLPKETPSSGYPLLSVALEDWIAERSRSSWKEKTASEHRVWISHFLATVGDRPIDQYRKVDAKAFKTALLSLPSNWNKKIALKGLSLAKAAEVAKAADMEPMSDSNLNKIIGFVAAFWNWADANFDDVQSGLFKGLKIKRTKSVREERDPFTMEELRKVFNVPIYRGCKSLRFWKRPGKLVPRDAGIYWVPLIGLYTGARLGEIIQLYVSDIKEENGVRYFDINEDGEDKRLKNRNSVRSIPIHQDLVQMGFLDLVESRKKARQKRVFPDLKAGDDGYYSSPFTKHFRRHLESIDIKRDTLTFHSFRHTFEDACRECGISKEIMDALQGHGEAGMSARYGRGYTLPRLNVEMQRIKYSGLELTHLYDEKLASRK